MSKLIKTDGNYALWIQELKERYKRSQIKAAAKVNQEMIRFYWSIGRDIVARDAENVYGSGFFKFFSEDLRHEISGSHGFSPQSLYYMKNMYLLYSEGHENFQQVVGNYENTPDDIIFSVPWGHHCTIIDKFFEKREVNTAMFYIRKTDKDNPTIGLLICKDKDNVLAQYALESSSQPIGVAEFQLTKFIPDEFKSSLPSIEDIESELK